MQPASKGLSQARRWVLEGKGLRQASGENAVIYIYVCFREGTAESARGHTRASLSPRLRTWLAAKLVACPVCSAESPAMLVAARCCCRARALAGSMPTHAAPASGGATVFCAHPRNSCQPLAASSTIPNYDSPAAGTKQLSSGSRISKCAALQAHLAAGAPQQVLLSLQAGNLVPRHTSVSLYSPLEQQA